MSMHPVRATGRYFMSGSTRFTTTGSKRKAPRLKTFGVHTAAACGGSAVGGLAGSQIGHAVGGEQGRTIGGIGGGLIGGHVGASLGRKFSTNRGYGHSVKPRMTVRAYHSIFHGTHQDIAKHSRAA